MNADEEYRWLFATEYASVVRTVWLVLHDHGRAEEVAQDAFLELFKRWPKVRDYDSPDAWVRRVALRRAIRVAQRERGLVGRVLQAASLEPGREATLPDGPDPEVLAAVKALPVKQRAVIVLYYLEDRPMSEIAHLLGISEATGRVHLHDGRKRLASVLGEEGVPSDVR